jgi:phenylalanine ammonia-lyase
MSDFHRTAAAAPTPVRDLTLSGESLTIQQVSSVARRRKQLSITEDESVRERMRAAEKLVHRAVDDGWRVYGVTTGFGSMSEVPVPGELAAASQANLLSFLATGAGRPIDREHVRAAMLLRANMLLRGVSGVRWEVVERLVKFVNADAVPVVGQLGSIGASGDLVPLAAIARAITGQGGSSRVMIGGQCVGSQTALARLGLQPLELIPKEGLAIVNGTSFSSAIAANCVYASRQLLAIAFASHAMMLRGLWGHDEPFLPFVHECKPHPGQIWSAAMMRQLLESDRQPEANEVPDQAHVQDCYSLRCLPQYMGPIVEGMARITHVVEREMNSVTDNPLVDGDREKFYQSGNFLGQYIGMAMDDLRRFLGLQAKHLDVQIARLVAPEFNHGLPASLHGNGDLSFNMGLKGLQITGNSIMPLLTYYGNPLVEHFPTHAEQFNQNVNGLSWGSANLAWQCVELFTHYTSVALIFAVQAVDLRAYQLHGHYDGRTLLGASVAGLYEAVYETCGCRENDVSPLVFNDADQSLEINLARLSQCVTDEGSIVAAVDPILESLDEFIQQG